MSYYIFPSRAVWDQYVTACEGAGVRSAAYCTFCLLWKSLLPYITVMKPMTDLCSVCQQNSTAIMRAANLPEEEKSEVCDKTLYSLDSPALH